MSISGIGTLGINRTVTQPPIRDPRTQGQQPATVSAPAQTTQTSAASGTAAQNIPAEAPAGTDPALWSVLSGEERAFFAKSGAMGPLTYGRAFSQMKSTQLPANRGGRLDVKV